MAIIILEGPDGAGKSTLAEALVSDAAPFPCTRLVHTSQPTHPCGAYFEYLDTIVELGRFPRDWLTVLDRFHFGEFVYGRIMRGGSDLDEREGRLVETMLSKIGAVKVYVTADPDVLVRRAFGKRGEDFVNEDQLRKVAASYRTHMDGLNDWVKVDTTDDPAVDEVCRRLWRLVKEIDVRRAVLGA